MPRDNDKDNDSRGRRDRPGGGRKGRSGVPRGPEKKFAKRGFAGKSDRDERPSRGDRDSRPFRRREEGGAPRRDLSERPRFKRDDRASEDRGERSFKPRGERPFADRSSRDGEKRPSRPRGDRPPYGRDDRPPRSRDRDDSRSAGRSGDRKYGDKRAHAPRGARPERKFDGERKFSRGGPDRKRDAGDRERYTGDRKRDTRDRQDGARDRGDSKPWQNRDAGRRGERPRKDFGGRDRGDAKPWQKREDRGGSEGRPARTFDRPRFDRPREERGGEERPRFSRSRDERPKFDRPRRERDNAARPGRSEWQEHPRSEKRHGDRPRRDNEDDSRIFAKRPAFGGRGEYRGGARDDRPAKSEAPKAKKTGERIAKVLARAGLASRRDAEEWVVQGRVAVNGRVINSPALDVTANDVVAVDGEPLPPRERTRLFLYHKPRGLMTTHADPEGRPTVFDNLPEGLPRLISIGRLDFNTEGLLLLTNDGGLARVLELPDTGWLRRYRVRAHGEITQAQLDQLRDGIEIDGVKYGPIEATLERDQGANVWMVCAIREGKNREVRNVLAHLGLEVNRLIRVSYGPFQLGELAEGEVQEVRTRVLREQLGEKVIAQAGADFATPAQHEPREAESSPREKKPFKPAGRSALIADRKGRRVLVQRTGSEEARERNEMESAGYGPPRRPKRGYHGKRDLRPRDE